MEIQPVQVSSVTQMKFLEKQRKKAKSGGFESMGLGPEVYRGIKRKGYKVPTPIQRKTMPLILSGLDVVAMARTGSGKTAAFLIPMLQKLKEHSATAGVRALILAPTRELAFQTFKFCKELGRFTGIQATLLVGGDSFESQFEQLAKSPDVLIATLGRLTHHLAEVEGMSLRSVEYVVFDEADRLFEMGFAEQLRTVLSQLSESRQTLLFSATLPRALADFAKAGLRDPELVRLDLETKISPDLKLAFFTLRPEEKPAALLYLVREQISSKQQTIVFVATKHHVEFLNAFLEQEGIQLSIVYGDMDQVARKIHLAKFRTRKTMLLLVTDVAARGIDIPLLDNVVNYDFPPKPKLFVHRVGRAARAGRVGTAYSFVTAEEMPYMLDLHLFLSKPIRPAPTEEEVAYDSDNVLALIQDAEEKGETIYGKFPQSVLDLVSEKLRELLEDYSEIYLLHKACMNAFRLYSKTKPAPSTESVRRAKEFPREGLHPIFKLDCAKNEVDALAFSERLKEFRPKQTVLETEGEVAKAKKLHTPICQGVDVMKMKRAIHEKVINATQQQKVTQKTEIIPNDNDSEAVASVKKRKRGIESLVKKSFRDEEYYINPIPSNQHTEAGLSVKAGENFGPNRIDAAVLDLVADDSSGIQKQKARHHWDKKSKKYIKLNNGDRVTASGKVKTEGGLKVKSGSTGLYKRWQERSHMKISAHRHGDEAHDDGSEERGQRGRNNKYTKRKPIPNANVRDEVRGVDQIRKQRQKKETKKILWNDKQKGAKGQNFGNKQRGSKGQSFGSKQKGSNGQSFGKSGKRSFRGKGNRK